MNQDGRTNIADAICTLSYVFGPPDAPCKTLVARCCDAGDTNDDGRIDIADAVMTLDALFGDGTPIPEPSGACGADTT